MDNFDYYGILFFGGIAIGMAVLMIIDMLYLLR